MRKIKLSSLIRERDDNIMALRTIKLANYFTGDESASKVKGILSAYDIEQILDNRFLQKTIADTHGITTKQLVKKLKALV